MPTYTEKLKDPRWQQKRLKILERDGWKCQSCSHVDKPLHVHHRIYSPSLDPWECDDQALVTLCEDCHEAEKDEMATFLPIIIDQLKLRFLGDDLRELAYGISFMDVDPRIQSKFLARAISWAFTNSEIMNAIIERKINAICQEADHGQD